MKNKTKTALPSPVLYFASLKAQGRTYVASGKTALEAIQKIQPDRLLRCMGILTLKKGDKEEQKVFPPLMMTRLFATSQMMREVALKSTLARFSL